MRIKYSWILSITICVLLGSCVSIQQYDYAPYDLETSIDVINTLKGDTLVIVIPTYWEQEELLKSALEKYPEKRKYLTKKIAELQKDRDRERVAIISAYDEFFSFCPVVFMPDNLVHDFEEGKEGLFFIDVFGRPDVTASYSNRNPIKLIKQFDAEWHIRINNKIIPNPFPNYFRYRNGLVYLLGFENIEQVNSNAAQIFNSRFNRFYANPNRKLNY